MNLQNHFIQIKFTAYLVLFKYSFLMIWIFKIHPSLLFINFKYTLKKY